jgi:hypothetical protein
MILVYIMLTVLSHNTNNLFNAVSNSIETSLTSTSATSQSRVMDNHKRILTCERLALRSSQWLFNDHVSSSSDQSPLQQECPMKQGSEPPSHRMSLEQGSGEGALLSLVSLCVTSEIQEQALPPASFCTVPTAFPHLFRTNSTLKILQASPLAPSLGSSDKFNHGWISDSALLTALLRSTNEF